ncbi:MAG: M3 family oligoendopeptidase [Flavobacteriales bacterium]|nr:M3 family oligoendopeptidase [Flavobacteriales bacterium]
MIVKPTKARRTFIPESLVISGWSDLEPFVTALLDREIAQKDAYFSWLKDISELEAAIEEDSAWRYIRMTIDTTDEQAKQAYMTFVGEIQPKLAVVTDQLNRKIVGSEFADDTADKSFFIYFRGIRNEINLFREANIQLNTELQELSQEYSTVNGSMSVTIDGEEITMQKAGAKLQLPDRAAREQTFRAIHDVRLANRDVLDDLFDKMVAKRHQLALNAGFENFRDYKFAALGRFDYTAADCEAFHSSIEKAIVPIAKEILKQRKAAMKLDVLRPWDLACDIFGRPPLKPFEGGEELLEKSISLFGKIDSFFGNCLQWMKELEYVDLDSKPGKAPGGYNYPLYESGVPFIFMNAVGTPRDMVTMMHEGGHAVHSILCHTLPLTSFKGCPSEVAELASMSMELISLDHWDVFYTDADDLKRAKVEHLEDILTMLPWIAMVDAFQHWVYTNPTHTRDERTAAWHALEKRFGVDLVDWSGFEDGRDSRWQRQLHIFEVPFYYIEYGMAQLGALAVWKNHCEHPETAIQQYKDALSLGYTRSIGEIYNTAGIRFDFSENYILDLAKFVQSQLAKLH